MKHFNKAVRNSKIYIIYRSHANVKRQQRLSRHIGKNGKKVHSDENDFRHCYSNFLKVPSWKLLDHNYVRSSFSTIMRHIDKRILQDTPTMKDCMDVDQHTC